MAEVDARGRDLKAAIEKEAAISGVESAEKMLEAIQGI